MTPPSDLNFIASSKLAQLDNLIESLKQQRAVLKSLLKAIRLLSQEVSRHQKFKRIRATLTFIYHKATDPEIERRCEALEKLDFASKSLCVFALTDKQIFYQYGPVRDQFEPGFVASKLPSGKKQYVAYVRAVSAPSENMAWYVGGLRALNWGPIFQRNTNLTENAVNASNTLLTLDMATQTDLLWKNVTLPDGVKGRANPEVV
ncbi:hypothetical protein BN1723_014243 [Verticillium longisporum]|uniref:Uncharacterized protein n=1 Tax=Verticillium longisporum TaxID=100787 RepID=A0A0G4LX96_VERLO|nr:hypothetical protein BN1708_014582 [Verticillium longisporum]CRK29152.1 hypothetical protein BN1723_014243 [Verticillium longisporum]